MKAQILKIAGVKSEKEFYKKYPSEEAFMKAHGKAFKKAQMGTYIGGDAVVNPKMVNYATEYDAIDKMITGYTDAERRAAAKKATANQGGGGMDLSGIMEMFSKGEGAAPVSRYGNRIPRAYVGVNLPEWAVDAAETATDTTTIAPTFDVNKFGISAQTRLPRTNTPMQQPQVAPTNNTGFGGIMGNNTSGAPYAPGNVTQSNDYKMGEVNPQAASSPFDFAKAIPVVGGIIGGIQALGAQKEAKRAARQANEVSKVTLAASATRPEETKRRYVTPWDNPIQPGQMFPTYGVGTNVLARDGVRLQSGGEIQNTYAPDYLYDDLGYEPLNDSNVKQYYDGGDIPVAADGMQWGVFSKGGAGFGENPYGGLVSGVMGNNNNGGSQIGGSIGSIFGPVGGMVGSALGGMLDTDQRDIDKYNRETKRNMEGMAINNMIPGIHSGYRSHMQNGGYMNPEYNPQVITMFGDHTAEDFADYARKYRAGGHLKSYTPPSERAMEIYEDGGEIKTNQMGGISIESGGYLEPISWNPYTGGTGFTSKFHGQSHVEQDPDLDHTGIIMKYGGNADQQNGYQMEEGGDAEGNRIEAERGEYISERKDGGEAGESAQISGNRRYNPKLYDLGPKFNKEYANMKVKAIQGKIAEDDRKINIKESKNSQELTSFDPKTPQDKLYEGSLIANQLGYQMQYGINAAKTNNILAWQNSANGIIDEISSIHGKEINGDDFVKSSGTKINYEKEPLDSSKSKNGNKFMKAEEGITIDPGKITKAQRAAYLAKGYKQDPKDPNRLYLPGTSKEVITKIPGSKAEIKKGSGPIKDTYKGRKMSNADWAAFLKTKKGEAYKQKYITGTPDEVIKVAVPPSEKKEMITTPEDEVIVEGETPAPEEKTKFPWQMYVNALLPYFRPTDQEAFDYAQLYPEMYALGSNQLEPVPVQGYRPDLGTPYDISLQANMNEITAQTRAAQKMAQGNPAAQALIAGQAYDAINKVKEKEFIANQEMKDRVYGENRNILNQAKLTNLDIFDRQYGRQAEARSNTKATTQAALNSMADKMAKHKLENKTLGIYENLYNYRFGKDEVADNWNPLAQFNMQGRSNIGSSKDAAPEGYEYETILKKKKQKDARNGSIVKSYKNI